MDHVVTIADVVEAIIILGGVVLAAGTLLFLFSLFARGFDQ